MDRNQLFQGVIGVFGFSITILLMISFYFPNFITEYLIWIYTSFIGRNFVFGFILDPFFMLLSFGAILLIGIWKSRFSKYRLKDMILQENVILFKSTKVFGGFCAIKFSCDLSESLDIFRVLIKIEQENVESNFQEFSFSIEYLIGETHPSLKVNIFTESKSLEDIYLFLDKKISSLIEMCHMTIPSLDVEILSGESLQNHFYEILGGQIHDFDIDRGEVLVLTGDRENYVSMSSIRKDKITLLDFENIVRKLFENHSEENGETTFVFPFRFKGNSKIESSPYIVHRSEFHNNLSNIRKRINLKFSTSKWSFKNYTGRKFVQNLGTLLTRGLTSQKCSIILEGWEIHANISHQSDYTHRTPDLHV